MRDPYSVLGLSKNASAADIKKSYRRLAKKYHPDANSDDKKASEKFAEASAAYELLSDTEKRARFDRGEIDAEGNPVFHPGAGGPFGAGAQGNPFGGNGQQGFSAEDIFSSIFGNQRPGGARARTMRMKGEDRHYSLKVDFLDAVNGATRRITLPNGKTLNVKIPAGVNDGQVIRLKGQGEPGIGGGPAGDAMVTIEVGSHPLFERDGKTLKLELPITLYEAVLGGKVAVPVPGGSVQLRIPAGSSGGRVLRLKGKGVHPKGAAAGDLMVKLRIAMPPKITPELEDLMKKQAKDNPYNPRGVHYET
jgi:DnaJ-class molecular chaperone